jgi:hypothetical protein
MMLENVNEGGRKMNKHVEMWAKNVFDEQTKFQGFNIKMFIAIFSKHVDFV